MHGARAQGHTLLHRAARVVTSLGEHFCPDPGSGRPRYRPFQGTSRFSIWRMPISKA